MKKVYFLILMSLFSGALHAEYYTCHNGVIHDKYTNNGIEYVYVTGALNYCKDYITDGGKFLGEIPGVGFMMPGGGGPVTMPSNYEIYYDVKGIFVGRQEIIATESGSIGQISVVTYDTTAKHH